jgi:hypothetical protein
MNSKLLTQHLKSTCCGQLVRFARAMGSGRIFRHRWIILPSVWIGCTLSSTFAQTGANAGDMIREFPRGALQNINQLPNSPFRNSLEQLPDAARSRALQWLRTIHLPAADVESLQVDPSGGICYGCRFGHHHPHAGENERTDNDLLETPGTSAAAVAVSPFPGSLVFHSRPGAPNVLYINFVGETVTGTAWNTAERTSIPALPFSKDSDFTTFSDSEQLDIRRVWQRMAEDFAPFNINVTTERPASFNTRTAMVLITRNTDANGVNNPSSGAGGVAYVNVFATSSFASYRPAWVYHNNLGNSEANIAEAASHEIGHNLGLTHDGTTSSDYYGGHGSGDISWGPLMGTGYGRNVSQWCKGEYLNSNNTQDDLAQIAAKISYVADDHSNSPTGATALTITNGTQILSTTPENDPTNSNTANKGIIERNNDIDVFSFVTGSGPVRLNVNPGVMPAGTRGGNLDVLMELYNESNVLIAGSNPASLTTAVIETNLPAGRYFLHIKNTGTATPQSSPPSGYTSYGSIGRYFVSGSVTEATGVVIPPSADLLASNLTQTGTPTHTFTVTYTDDVAINVATITTGDIRVTGPGGYNQIAQLVSINNTTNGTPRTATYSVTPPGGGVWAVQNNGSYQIFIESGQVADIEGAFVAPAQLGQFTVSIPILYYTANMNSNPGWTLESPWAFGTPAYNGSNVPSSAFTGSNIIATNLSGSYANNLAAKYATTPAINTTGSTSLTLRFMRWLRKRNQDAATIQASADNGPWVNVWSSTGQILDGSWQLVQYSLPAGMAGSSSIRLRWSLSSNNSQNDIGWNIDDLQLLGDGSLDTAPPVATLSVADLTSGGSPSHACSITFTDETSVRLASLESSDLLVTGPNGYSSPPEFVGADLPMDGSPITGSYSIPAPGGGLWSAAHNGTYTISLIDGAVEDIWNNPTPTATLGTFAVNISIPAPGVLTVTPPEPWNSSGFRDGTFTPDSKTYTLTNSGDSPLSWTAATNSDWIELNTTTGSLPAGASVAVTATLTTLASTLQSGEYADQLVFSNTSTGNGDTTRDVTLTILNPGSLTVENTGDFNSTGTLGGSFTPNSKTYTLSNTGGGEIQWTAVPTSPWITLGNTGGALAPGASIEVLASINEEVQSLAVGGYQTTIHFINSTNGNGTAIRNISLTVLPQRKLAVAAPEKIGNGAFRILVSGNPGEDIILEASSTLGGWEQIATGQIGEDGTVTFEDPQSTTLPARFYRVKTAP